MFNFRDRADQNILTLPAQTGGPVLQRQHCHPWNKGLTCMDPVLVPSSHWFNLLMCSGCVELFRCKKGQWTCFWQRPDEPMFPDNGEWSPSWFPLQEWDKPTVSHNMLLLLWSTVILILQFKNIQYNLGVMSKKKLKRDIYLESWERIYGFLLPYCL